MLVGWSVRPLVCPHINSKTGYVAIVSRLGFGNNLVSIDMDIGSILTKGFLYFEPEVPYCGASVTRSKKNAIVKNWSKFFLSQNTSIWVSFESP
jgi:hypothetical protein